MSPPPELPAAARWGFLVALTFVCLLAGACLAFGGYIAGGEFATAPAQPGLSIVMWIGAGLALAAPVAALPRLGFHVRTRTCLITAAVLAIMIAVGGSLLSR